MGNQNGLRTASLRPRNRTQGPLEGNEGERLTVAKSIGRVRYRMIERRLKQAESKWGGVESVVAIASWKGVWGPIRATFGAACRMGGP